MGPRPTGNLVIPEFAHGSLEAELCTPQAHDPQKTHVRDEICVVGQGNGMFFDGTESNSAKDGSFLFVISRARASFARGRQIEERERILFTLALRQN